MASGSPLQLKAVAVAWKPMQAKGKHENVTQRGPAPVRNQTLTVLDTDTPVLISLSLSHEG